MKRQFKLALSTSFNLTCKSHIKLMSLALLMEDDQVWACLGKEGNCVTATWNISLCLCLGMHSIIKRIVSRVHNRRCVGSCIQDPSACSFWRSPSALVVWNHYFQQLVFSCFLSSESPSFPYSSSRT